MRKIAVVFALALALLASAASSAGAQAGKVRLIGFMGLGRAELYGVRLAALREGLRELGYEEGRNIRIEERYAGGDADRHRKNAAELVRLNPHVIVVQGDPLGIDRAAKKAGRAIPIVMAVSANPVELGIVASLARPGGNITGLSDFHTTLIGKRLELLKEAVPSASRVGFLWHSATVNGPLQWRNLQAAAPGLGVELLSFDIGGPGGIGRALDAIRKERPGGLVVQGNRGLIGPHYDRIRAFALENRLPTSFTTAGLVTAGGLMSYGANHLSMYRRAAYFVDRILKGAKLADLPIEQPTKFDLAINLRTAKALGLTIPPEILFRATRVIR